MIPMTIYWIIPSLASLYYSLTNYSVVLPTKWVGLENFRSIFSNPGFYSILRNSLVIATAKIVTMQIAAVALALLGVFLLTGASLTTLGLGESLGLACAIVFAIHLVLLNRLTRDDSPWRMAAGQFVWVALSMGLLALLTAPPPAQIQFAGFARLEIWGNLLLLVLVPTVFSFGVMFLYQPQVDPTRAAMIYLLEPVFASLIAWALVGRGLDTTGLAGAGLILVANGLAELRSAGSKQ